MANTKLMQEIRDLELETEATKADLKNWREQYSDVIAQLPEYATYEDAMILVRETRERLKNAIADSPDCQLLASRVEELSYKLRDQKDILSHHLIAYHDDTKETSMEEAGSKKVRPIILTAKLGKAEWIQEELFGGEK